MKKLTLLLLVCMLAGCSSTPPLPPEPTGAKTPINTVGGIRV